jgi:hypothetical protein
VRREAARLWSAHKVTADVDDLLRERREGARHAWPFEVSHPTARRESSW